MQISMQLQARHLWAQQHQSVDVPDKTLWRNLFTYQSYSLN